MRLRPPPHVLIAAGALAIFVAWAVALGVHQ
jgi:hypothetical protein